MAKPSGKEKPKNESKRKVASPSQGKVKKKRAAPAASRGQSQSCHQCRQSIHSNKGVTEVKSGKERLKCSQCTRFWCEQCLHNRYGIIKADMDPSTWICPVCNKNCNCSLCRRKEGKLATGILTPLVKNAGFDSVSEFLDKGTDDIAKVLQWKSPESGSTSKKRPDAESKPKPKRKRKRADSENSKSLANGTHSVSVSPTEPEPCCHSNDITDSSYHGDQSTNPDSGRPKRKRLSHSTYTITIEDDPVNIECSGSAKAGVAHIPVSYQEETGQDNGGGLEETECLVSLAQSPPQSTRGGSSNSLLDSPLVDESPLRRSPRRRKTTKRFSMDDFAVDSSKKKKKMVTFKSPPAISTCSDDDDDDGVSMEIDCHGDIKDHLESLKAKWLDSVRVKKVNKRREILEEKAKAREEERKKRQEEKAKAHKERVRQREERKLSRIASQEKVKLARNLLKEAKKDVKRRQREREKQRKQEELEKLKIKRQGEKKKLQELTSIPTISSSNEVNLGLVEDSPECCEAAGIPPLPELPPLKFTPLPSHLLSHFLFVSEFLSVFSAALNLKRKLEAGSLCKLISGGRGLGEVYLQLLKVLVEDDDKLHKELKPSRSQRDLEQVAKKYLHDNGKNGFISVSIDDHSLEESLIMLHHLCQEVLDSSVISDYIASSKERSDLLKKEQRVREKEKSKQISDELKQLCEAKTCSLEDIEAKRSEFMSELQEMRNTCECELYTTGLALRNTFIGKDRHDRVYWLLQSIPGVIVELGSQDGEAEGVSWMVINSIELLEQFMECLHPGGEREKLLLDSLLFHKTGITAALSHSSQGRAIKKFYGH